MYQFCLLFFLLVFGLFPATSPAQTTAGFDRELFRNHGAVMLLIDADNGAIVDANRAAEAFYRYTREQLQRMTIQQINTLSAAEVEQEYRRAAQQERNYFLFEHRLADGSVRPVEVYSSPVMLSGKKILHSIIIDVSHREQLQHQMAANETRLRFAEQVAGLGHWTLDLETDSYRFSEGALALLGLDGEYQSVADILARVVPEDRERMRKLRQQLIAGQQDYRIDIRFKRPDGRSIDLHSQGVYDAKTNSIFGVIHDVTEARQAMRDLKAQTVAFVVVAVVVVSVLLILVARMVFAIRRRKKAEAALRYSEQRFDELARQNHSIVWEVDAEGRYVFISEMTRELLGYAPEEIVGHKYFYDLHPQQGREEFRQATFAVIERREVFRNLENPIQTRSGRILWVATTAMPILDENGTLRGYRGTDTDITERKAAETALQRKNEEMEQFIYSVSHDLKSPLITIESFLGILQKKLPAGHNDGIDTAISYIGSAARKMTQLLEALLQLSRVGRMENPAQTIACTTLIEDCARALSGIIARRGVEVRLAATDIRLHGDLLRLGQIWQNLLENAVKYLGGQPQPCIEVGVEEKEGETVFYVRDNGMGIDPAQQERVFHIFTQLDPESDGSGLGLALVKKIVERYDGRIWVESAGAGQGSCFRFTLPAALADRGES